MGVVKLDMVLEKSSTKAAVAEISMKYRLAQGHDTMGRHRHKDVEENVC
jgi:hypothetical protein